MSSEFNLIVNKRDLINKGGRKRVLKKGKVPGVYYSHDSKESIPFYIEKTELSHAQKADTQIFNIAVGGKKRNVLFKSIQYHPVTDEIIHIDLYGIKMDQLVSVNVTINVSGTAKGVIEGGILIQNLNEVELECLPMDIPQSVDIDVSHLNIGDSLRCEELVLDEKLKLKTPEDQIIISVTQPMKEEEIVPEIDEDAEFIDGEDAEEGAEGEEGAPSEQSKEEPSAKDDDKQGSEG